MTLKEIIAWLGRKEPSVYAALCTARADGSVARYQAGDWHSILAMVRAEENEAESAIAALLQAQGWREVAIEEKKRLEVPFVSEDRRVRACYVCAVTSVGGTIVYSEPFDDEPATGQMQHV